MQGDVLNTTNEAVEMVLDLIHARASETATRDLVNAIYELGYREGARDGIAYSLQDDA